MFQLRRRYVSGDFGDFCVSNLCSWEIYSRWSERLHELFNGFLSVEFSVCQLFIVCIRYIFDEHRCLDFFELRELCGRHLFGIWLELLHSLLCRCVHKYKRWECVH